MRTGDDLGREWPPEGRGSANLSQLLGALPCDKHLQAASVGLERGRQVGLLAFGEPFRGAVQ